MRELKDSGIEWIEEIPSEWKTSKLKFESTFKQKKYSVEYGNLNYIGLENIVAWNGRYIESDSQYDREQSLICEKDDILFGKLRPYLAKVFICPFKQCCSGEFCVISVHNQNNRFVWYQLISHGFIFMVDRSTYGTKMPRANADYIKNMQIVIPSIEEQQKIASFLDRKCSEIDAVIEKTKATIEEYKKLKQSVITEAVTKGIRGDRPMKDSGIEWIGEIPAEWEIRKLFRAIDNIGDIDHYMPNSVATGIPYLMTGDLKEKLSDVDFGSCKMVSLDDYQTLSSKIKANKGDIIFARYATIGTVCFVDIEKEFLVSYSCLTIKPTKNLLLGRFLFYYLKSAAFFEEVNQYINSNTQANVGLDSMTKAKVILPKIEEQTEIADYLDKKCAEIDTLIAKKTALLEEMESYKKSVIYEYVTGKKEL